MTKNVDLWSDRFFYSSETIDLPQTKEKIELSAKEFIDHCGHNDDLPVWLTVPWLSDDYYSRSRS